MRNKFFSKLVELSEKEKDLFFVTADLGFGVIEKFRDRFPDRFLNVGVSEQAMIGIAAGMANEGKKVICYSITPFSWLRPFEFYRNGVLATQASVMVVGVGPGFDYSHDGITHYCFEDLALAQSQPNLHINLSTYKSDVESALEEFIAQPRPTYVRLPRREPIYSNLGNISETEFESKSDILILSHGLMVDRANFFLERYRGRKISAIGARLTNLNQRSIDSLIKKLKYFRLVHVIEDHYRFGGLATRLSKELIDQQINIKLINDSVSIMPIGEVGSFAYMEDKLFFNKELLVDKAIELLNT